MKNFRLVSTDINNKYQKLLAGLSPDGENHWMWNTASMGTVERTRRETEGSPHKDTKAIIFRGPANATHKAFFEDTYTIEYPWPSSIPVVSLAYQLAYPCLHETWKSTPPGRMMIVSLTARGKIARHKDEGKYAESTSRYHVVLQSDEGNEFECDGETVHMKPGEMWWFDHKKPHSVVNNSDRDRIHLIVDAFVS